MSVRTPTTDGLGSVLTTLASWQRDNFPVQLHPGDLGWQWRHGADALADSLRVWCRDEEIVAIGFVDLNAPGDGPTVIRMAVAPPVDQDDEVARALVRDLEDASTGVLPEASATVEARCGQAFRSLLDVHGWRLDEPWTPLRRDLTHPVEGVALRVETVGTSHVEERVAVQRAAFPTSTFTVDRWHTMAAGIPYERARCLVGYDDAGAAVATVTVWSAGSGRPGLIEPMGVHRDHRGKGHGTTITLAAAAALRELGSSSAVVATPSSNTGGVATYAAAGFEADPDVTDFRRPAWLPPSPLPE
jgi:GNAT superfamily N-acetyltransferase